MSDEKDFVKLCCFESIDFAMYLNLPGLYKLPAGKARKIFALMHSCPEGNAEAIQRTAEWLDAEVQTAQFAAQEAERAYQMGYDPSVSPKSRSPTTADQRRLNVELAEAVRRAKLDYKNTLRLQNYFIQERKF